jgi:hypothetical protein
VLPPELLDEELEDELEDDELDEDELEDEELDEDELEEDELLELEPTATPSTLNWQALPLNTQPASLVGLNVPSAVTTKRWVPPTGIAVA